MRKRIASTQLEPGMFLEELCGDWMQHPFWRTRFLIENEEQVSKVIDAGILEVVIDTRKGKSPETTRDRDLPPEKPLSSLPASPYRHEPVSLSQELRQASRIVAKGKEAVVDMFQDARLGKAISTDRMAPLVEEISDSMLRNPSALVGLARIKTADEYTYMHSVAVCALMVTLAREMGLNEDQVREAGLAGLLHDVGKVFVPGEILNKPGRLTEREFEAIKAHPDRGHQALIEGGEATEVVLDVVRHHHEKIDGTGYPDGLKDEQISRYARMGAICDVYDAVTSNRPYKQGWDPATAISRMAKWTDGHLDETLFQHFVKALGIYPTGSLVRLGSGRLAVVTEQNREQLLSPRVVVFYSTSAGTHLPPKALDLALPGTQESIKQREDPAKWGFENLERLWA
ncbi:HD-GYP domain-containing protein [Natronospira bacteriovora]|uniref:HD-GYP domain-containing protein n=1 Tax=Natronospira bacteriovora TaxID=3069753 RepID=A0ABU0W6X8_9GAMM|nr:HD-GYP domain-containing protein [Natronospira sp. AB-CW4]MDQ2069220.1 HD-GYP domain-containing protein [Natronospira sp. AB-CW4]